MRLSEIKAVVEKLMEEYGDLYCIDDCVHGKFLTDWNNLSIKQINVGVIVKPLEGKQFTIEANRFAVFDIRNIH